MKQTLKAAFFDLDGTLIDSEPHYTEIWTRIGAKHRPDIPDLAHRIKGTTLKQILEYFPTEAMQQEVLEELWMEEDRFEHVFFPGAMAFVRDLQQHGVRTAIVTSSDRRKVDRVRACLPEIDSFDMILQSCDFQKGKPAPDCYLEAARRMGLQREECVVFEDAFAGLQAGRAAGMFTLGLPTGLAPEAIADKCDYVLPTWEGFSYELLVEILEK